MRFDAAGTLQESIRTNVNVELTGHLLLQNGGWLIYSHDGSAALRIDTSGKLQGTIPTGTTDFLTGHLQLQSGDWLLYGYGGSVFVIDDGLAMDLEAFISQMKEQSEADIDWALLDFLNFELRDYDFEEVVNMRTKLSEIIAQRRIVAARFEAIKKALDSLPTGAYFLQQQRETFAGFMNVCRGVEVATNETTDADALNAVRKRASNAEPDAITLACAEAWQMQEANDAGRWWQELAAQVPPGILLLFLLSTLGGLYRYNLRLAGFHNSRADLLEMMHEKPELFNRTTSDGDIVPFAVYADALAADKVEFGKASTPSDQVLELVRAVMARGK